MTEPLLDVQGLLVEFPSPEGRVRAVHDVGFAIARGETLALVGESGCGKSMSALALLGLVPAPGRVEARRLAFRGRDLGAFAPADWRGVRGRGLSLVFQEPMTSLNPVFTVGFQLAEAIAAGPEPEEGVRARSAALLREVGVPEAEKRLDAYPHELSGGLRQRVMIAMAIAADPDVLVADEPTTALDVTVEAQIMALLDRLKAEREMALLLITHDLGLVAQHADRVAVLYAGRVVEEAPTAALFARPLHPYTRGLLGSMPGRGGSARKGRRLAAIPGIVPHPLHLPSGCAFRERCPQAVAACAEGVPELRSFGGAHAARCILVDADA